METSLTLFSNSTTSEVLYQVINALTMKYRGRCPRLVHLSADYAPRHWNNQHVSMLVKGKRSVHPPLRSRSQDTVQTMGEKAACLHDETSAFDHEKNLDGNVTKKEIPERRGLPSMEDLLIKKNLGWTGHLMSMSPDRLPKQWKLSLSHCDRQHDGDDG